MISRYARLPAAPNTDWGAAYGAGCTPECEVSFSFHFFLRRRADAPPQSAPLPAIARWSLGGIGVAHPGFYV